MKRIRKLLVLLLVLAYAGQAVAALILPCPQMAAAGTAVDMTGMAGMGHAGHAMAGATDTAPATDDCCGSGGPCTMSHCQWAAVLPLDPPGGGLKYAAPYPPTADTVAEFHSVDSLFRPPISR